MRRFPQRAMLTACAFFSTITLSNSADHDPFWTPVHWSTSDGVRLEGDYHAASGSSAWTWVLLHGYQSNRNEWYAFGKKLAARHQGILVFDLRGHGQSTRMTNGNSIDFHQWTSDSRPSPFGQMPGDLASAIEFLKTQFHLDPKRIAVGGASLGANVAITYAAQHRQVPAVMLLSPGLDFGGLPSPDAFIAYGRSPVLLAASPGDTYSFQTIQALARLRGDAALRVLEEPDPAHGVNMFKNEAFTDDVLAWMVQVAHS